MGSRSPIVRFYVPYWDWEDWKNGMWNKSENEIRDTELAVNFMSDTVAFSEAMQSVITSWPYTMLNSLTNTGTNRMAFLGQCAVCFAINIPEHITRSAWKELTEEKRLNANNSALTHIKNYEEEYRIVHTNMGAALLS